MTLLPVLVLAASLVCATPFKGPALTLAEKRNNDISNSTETPYDYYTTYYSAFGAKDTKEVCVVAHTEGQDDTPNLIAAWEYCGNKDVEIVFAKNTTYNIWSPFALANMSNVLVSIEGNLNFPENRTLIQQQVANITAYATYGKAYMSFQGEDVTIRGSHDAGSGWISCFGDQWWQIESTNYTDNSLSANRPQTLAFDVERGSLLDLKIHKQIAWNIALLGSYNYLNNTFIYGVSNNSAAFPFNTDGFNVKSQHTLIENSVVYGGDDCVAIVSGADDLLFRNAHCRGTHGLSVGSLGKGGANSTVTNIIIRDVLIEKSTYAARFKSWVGGAGYGRNITWENIESREVIQPIFVTQSYYDQQFGPPKDVKNQSTEITDLTFKNFWGDIDSFAPKLSDFTCVSDPCWNYVPDADGSQAIILELDHLKTVSGLKFIDIGPFVASNQKSITVLCDPTTLPQDELDNLGFVCADGPLITTA
ncbi:pectin lyase fold/virulence factor [Mrakia frigida]|uniref:pectin lyase fold/virulence factor n=1 Tax=Mrakia frigida TaxID=29902 RepID=UPI003FCC09B8